MSMADDEDQPQEIRRKRPLSMSRDAVRKRKYRREKKKMEKDGIVMVPTPISPRIANGFAAKGYLDTHLERIDPIAAYRKANLKAIDVALGGLLDARPALIDVSAAIKEDLLRLPDEMRPSKKRL